MIRRQIAMHVEEAIMKANPKGSLDPHVVKEAEGQRLLKSLQPKDFVIVLDERGQNIDSERMARMLAEAGETGQTCLAFCIGGPFGHSQAVKARANKMISLSNLVLNHQVARIVLLEALYRSHTILRGGGNAQKSAMARARNADKAGSKKGSQLKANATAQSVVCQICRQTFLCTATEQVLKNHQDSKHPKNTFAACFPEKA